MLADRVLHTSTTTGTGSYDLIDPTSTLFLSAVAAVGSGNRLTYAVEMDGVWELCWGVVTAGSLATLTRNLIRSSTGALINWSAGTKTIYSIAQADLLRFGARGLVPTSGGTANAQTITHATPLRTLLAGMEVQWLPGFTNTAAAQINVDALGLINVVSPQGGALVGGEVWAGQLARAVYDGTSWRLVALPFTPALPASVGGTANAITLTHALPRPLVRGLVVQWIPGATNTGATTLNSDTTGATAVVAPGGGALVGGEIRNGRLTSATFDGTSWRLNDLPMVPQAITSTSGGNWTLPAGTGSRWGYFAVGFTTATGAWNTQTVSGEGDGGAVIINAAGVTFTGHAWRTA